jgi:hypothetical protein
VVRERAEASKMGITGRLEIPVCGKNKVTHEVEKYKMRE